MSQILTREEFHERMLAYGGDVIEYNSTDIRTFAQGRAVDTSAGRVMAAYDAALARIAELESPAHRARIAREFYDEAVLLYTDAAFYESPLSCIQDLLARWEAAAKEGE